MRDLIVNGVPLRDPLRQWSIDYTRSTLFSAVSRRFESESAVGFHGVQSTRESFFTSGQGTIVLNVQGNTAEEFNRNASALQSLFNLNSYTVRSAPQKSPLIQADPDPLAQRSGRVFDVPSYLLREARTRTVGSIPLERINDRAGRLTIILERPATFWSGSDWFSAVLASGINDLSALNVSGDSTAPLVLGKVRIKGPFAAGGYVTISDQGRTDKSVTFSPGALTASQYMLVDLNTMMATIGTSSGWDLAGTDARSKISSVGSGSFTLEPETVTYGFPDVTNRYRLSLLLVGNSAGSQVAVNYRRSYLS